MFGALDENTRYVSPIYASRESTYVCPDCGEPVILRRGEHNRAHFAHKHQSDQGIVCALYDAAPGSAASKLAESRQHYHAKMLLAEYLAQNINRHVGVRVDWCCANSWCKEKPVTKCIRMAAGQHVETEHRVNNNNTGDTIVLDIGIIAPDNTVVAAIEIRQTHAVENPRPRPCYEFLATDVLRALEARQTGEAATSNEDMRIPLASLDGFTHCLACTWATGPLVDYAPTYEQGMPCIVCGKTRYSATRRSKERSVAVCRTKICLCPDHLRVALERKQLIPQK